jgi:hypothetical protein
MTRGTTSEPETTRLTITWSKQADLILRSYLGAPYCQTFQLFKLLID